MGGCNGVSGGLCELVGAERTGDGGRSSGSTAFGWVGGSAFGIDSGVGDGVRLDWTRGTGVLVVRVASGDIRGSELAERGDSIEYCESSDIFRSTTG
jgi:hypothetical protein